jgi:hypothetical protein
VGQRSFHRCARCLSFGGQVGCLTSVLVIVDDFLLPTALDLRKACVSSGQLGLGLGDRLTGLGERRRGTVLDALLRGFEVEVLRVS